MPRENVIGVFAEPVEAANAIRSMRANGHGDLSAIMPAPFPEVLEALGTTPSPLGWATLTGAILGTTAGFALCISTARAWPLMTGGKPIVSIPTFAVIAFEVTVLVGALVTLVSLALAAVLARRSRGVPRNAEFSADTIGVYARVDDADDAEKLFREAGAKEVRRGA